MAAHMDENSHVEKEKLTIEIVKELGGNELFPPENAIKSYIQGQITKNEDLKFLQDVDDGSDSEVENPDEDFDAEPIKKDEIRDFIKKLGIHQHRPKEESEEQESKPEKKQKPERSVEETTVTSPSTSDGTKGMKNKEKNKFKVQHDEVTSTTKDPTAEYKTHIKSYQKRKYLLVKAGEHFDDQNGNTVQNEKCSEEMVKQMEDFASKLLQDEISVYNKQRENTKKSDVRWMKTVLSSGTLADKMAALTVLIQESALHNLSHVDTLLSMARKKGRRENTQATDALKEIFLTDLVPGDRKLNTFSQHNISDLGPAAGWNKDAMDKRLIMWYAEAQLKTKYAEFVKVLETLAHDTVLSTKQKAVKIVFDLLVSKPEQEKALLGMLINKVGDPHYKLAATVSHLLTKLVEHHPNMKTIVVREVEYLLFRPNIAERAQYYSVCFLNQLKLSHDEKELASKLVGIYFSFFKVFVKKGEVDSKMMSALLTGVNRAYPYSKLEEKVLGEKLEHLYKIVHIVNFNTAIQALSLLYQVMDAGQTISERYYSALYRKLLDPALKMSSKQAVFLNLLFKSMKKDESERRLKAFMKRLLQVCSFQQPQFTCGALILLSEVLREKPGLLSLSHTEEDSDEEEHFVDEPDPEENTDVSSPIPDTPTPGTQHKKTSWVHRANLNHKSENVNYDPFHRNPLYCHAENECIWELENLARHFHPSVSLFAKQILKGETIHYTGDPLSDFTLIRFLDRFVYKNPKKKEEIEEKAFRLSRKKSAPAGIKGMAVTSDQFLQLEENRVPVDDIFLHRYFQQKAERDGKKKDEEEEGSDVESITDAEFDDFLDKYEGKLEGQDFSDLDIDFSSEFGKKKGKSGQVVDSDDSDDDEDLDDDLSDEEMDFDDDELAKAFKDELEGADDDEDFDFDDSDDDDGGDDDMGDFADADDYADDFESDDEGGGVEGGFNEEDVEFSDADDEFASFKPQNKKRKAKDQGLPGKKGKKTKSSGDADLHDAAEQFSSMIDETAGSKLNMIGSEALANKDKADVKQLKWEMDRERWMNDKNKRNFRKGGGKFSKRNKGGGHGNNRSGKPWQGKNKGKKQGNPPRKQNKGKR